MTDNSLLEAALQWSRAGYYVFPCVAGEKRPACSNGVLDATTDETKIRQWWSDDPRYNIGVAPARSGCFVLDVDPPLGFDSLETLIAEHGALPATLAVRTPRGGLHYWFEGDCPTTASRLGPKLDTRGRGGYVLVPPSIVNGASYDYEGAEDSIAIGPGWLQTVLSSVERGHFSNPEGAALDTATSVERARHLLRGYVEAGRVAREGAGGDDLTYRVAAEVLNLGLSPKTAWQTLLDEWNEHCLPPWEPDDLAVKVRNAAEYAQNDIGAWAVPPAAEVFADAIQHVPRPERSKFYPRDESEQDVRPDPTWLVPNLLADQSTAMMYGPSGSLKSFLALDLALQLAAGLPGWKAPARDPLPVVYAAAEGALSIERKRRPAWREYRGITAPLPFYAIDTVPLVARPQEVLDLIEAIRARNVAPRLVVLDTQARAMAGMNENDAKDAGSFIEAIELIKRAFSCTVLVLHHTGNDVTRPRGSSALFAGYDTVIEVKRESARSRNVAVHVRKQKDADEPETPWTFESHVVASTLVLSEIDPRTNYILANQNDPLSPTRVSNVLREIGAVGPAKGVPGQVLAQSLTPTLQDDDPETYGAAVARIAKGLAIASRDKLSGYNDGGRVPKWYAPDNVRTPTSENRSEDF